jgi:gliding motility-associated-like protein
VLNKDLVAITVFLDTTQNCQGIDILRSADGINYTTVGFVARDKTPHYTYTDNNSSTQVRSYFYKAVIKDSCGNTRAESNVARTILLKVKEDENLLFTRHLSWSDYLGFNGGVKSYSVYRIVNDVIESTPVGKTDSATTYFTDQLEAEAPKGSKIEYFVRAIEGIYNTYGLLGESDSNPATVYTEGLIFVPNAFAPDGVNKTWHPVTQFVDKNEYHVRVFDRYGHVQFETSNDSEGWDGGGLPAGNYIYLINYKNSRGEYLEKKGNVLLVR